MQSAQANKLVIERRIDPCMSEVFGWDDIPRAHEKMLANEHKPGNMAVLVQAKTPGLRTLEDAREAQGPVLPMDCPSSPVYHRREDGRTNKKNKTKINKKRRQQNEK
eukprot:TRINITY_DN3007_c2_g1_i1.p4 TRINITY_DN3007_c2_g1~~TRINITY_DN3007_c2_g1_i1.p4  ORF type:complete len:107 (-),score=12.99 TRINITY_DN3007_c2_g1_i1:30-350(-)